MGTPGEKAWEAGEERAGSGSPEVAGTGRIENILQHFVIFCNRNGTKRRESLQKGAGNGSKSYGKREKKIREVGVSDPPPPPPPCPSPLV